MNTFVGAKFNRNLDVAEIAKLYRADVKEALKAKKLGAGLKLSVKIDRFSGGCSIDVAIVALPSAIPCPFTKEYLAFVKDGANAYPTPTRLVPEALALVTTLMEMLQAYNRDSSDSTSDYFNVRFYSDVRLDSPAYRAENFFQVLEA